ncbi:hypothetical protein HMH01_05650 [Halovulum dunhuangense]|uniref:Uncharacterized protein n=1 Tax=Halovulum dunhuangense TaxID=1505036 RepID=A0A849L124_9RHOB|nr:hypothetical protein [Halovulum dunhuangense]NNU79919.1 hypothetical protein [Halovulum dunhuangense]
MHRIFADSLMIATRLDQRPVEHRPPMPPRDAKPYRGRSLRAFLGLGRRS